MSMLGGNAAVAVVTSQIAGPAGWVVTAFDIGARLVQSQALPKLLGLGAGAAQAPNAADQLRRAELILADGGADLAQYEPSFSLANEYATNPYYRAALDAVAPNPNAIPRQLVTSKPDTPPPVPPIVQPAPKGTSWTGGNAAPAPVAPQGGDSIDDSANNQGEYDKAFLQLVPRVLPNVLPRAPLPALPPIFRAPVPVPVPPGPSIPSIWDRLPWFKSDDDKKPVVIPEPQGEPEADKPNRTKDCVNLCQPVCEKPKPKPKPKDDKPRLRVRLSLEEICAVVAQRKKAK